MLTLDKIKRGFTLIEILVVVIVLGLLTSIVVIQVDRTITRAVSQKAESDVNLLNNAVTQWKASYPSVNFESTVTTVAGGGDEADAAFNLIRPFLGLPATIETLEHFNNETSKMYVYAYNSGIFTHSLVGD